MLNDQVWKWEEPPLATGYFIESVYGLMRRRLVEIPVADLEKAKKLAMLLVDDVKPGAHVVVTDFFEEFFRVSKPFDSPCDIFRFDWYEDEEPSPPNETLRTRVLSEVPSFDHTKTDEMSVHRLISLVYDYTHCSKIVHGLRNLIENEKETQLRYHSEMMELISHDQEFYRKMWDMIKGTQVADEMPRDLVSKLKSHHSNIVARSFRLPPRQRKR